MCNAWAMLLRNRFATSFQMHVDHRLILAAPLQPFPGELMAEHTVVAGERGIDGLSKDRGLECEFLFVGETTFRVVHEHFAADELGEPMAHLDVSESSA